MFPVPNVAKTFDKKRQEIKKTETDKLSKIFLAELLENMEANKKALKT